MRFIDWFAGIGGFRKGMELAGHECVGFCEFDKYAVMSYTSMHLLTEEQRGHLLSMDFKKRQKEILKEKYRNGEWYAADIRRVYAGDIPDSECWCFGFPCQDISTLPRQRLGIKGNRSSLFFRVIYLLGQLSEDEKPEWLFIENVKNLLSINGGWDFARLLVEMDKGGYDAEWQVLNSKFYGVPQNRERCYIIGHLRDKGERKVFPVKANENKAKILQVAEWDVERKNSNNYRVYSTEGIAPTLTASTGGGKLPRIMVSGTIRQFTPREFFRLQGWADDYFEKAQQFNSDSQLYKQAGNGVTVNVIQAIAEKFNE